MHVHFREREPGNCFMLFGFSCNICCFGSCSTNANSTNFLKTEPMRLPFWAECECVCVCVATNTSAHFAAIEVILKMHYRFISLLLAM